MHSHCLSANFGRRFGKTFSLLATTPTHTHTYILSPIPLVLVVLVVLCLFVCVCVCARSIAIFCACLALSTGLEIVVFSPARRASRKLLERIVEFIRLLDFDKRIIEYNQEQCRLTSLTGKISLIRSFPSKVRSQPSLSLSITHLFPCPVCLTICVHYVCLFAGLCKFRVFALEPNAIPLCPTACRVSQWEHTHTHTTHTTHIHIKYKVQWT